MLAKVENFKINQTGSFEYIYVSKWQKSGIDWWWYEFSSFFYADTMVSYRW